MYNGNVLSFWQNFHVSFSFYLSKEKFKEFQNTHTKILNTYTLPKYEPAHAVARITWTMVKYKIQSTITGRTLVVPPPPPPHHRSL